MEKKQQEIQQQINIELPKEVAEGVYVNLVVVTHSPAEFIFDFVTIMPGVPQARVKSRLIMSPFHAKRFLQVLKENIARYEAMHGEIPTSEQFLPDSFMGPGGKA